MKLGYLIHSPKTLATIYRTRQRGQFKVLEHRLSDLAQSKTRGFRFLAQPDFSPLEREFEKWGKEPFRFQISADGKKTEVVARPDRLSDLTQLEIGRDIFIFAPANGGDEQAEYAVQVGVGVVIIAGIAIGGWLAWEAIDKGVSVTITTPAATITVEIGGGGGGDRDGDGVEGGDDDDDDGVD